MNKQGVRCVYIYIYISSLSVGVQHRRLGMEGGGYIINAFTFSHSSNQNCESCWVTLYNNRDIIPRARFIVSLVFLPLHSFIPFTYPVASLFFGYPFSISLSLSSRYLANSLVSLFLFLVGFSLFERSLSLSLSLGAYVHAEKTITSTYIHATR